MNSKDKRLKTIVVIDNLYTGGVASSLYNFLHYSKDYFDIDLLVFNDHSIDFSKIPDGVRVLKADPKLKILGLSQRETFSWSKFHAFRRLCYVLCSRVISGEFARKILFSHVKNVGSYDLAISFAQDNSWNSLSKGCIDFVIGKTTAKRKATFIHCDYSNFGGYSPRQEKAFSRFTDIVCVSESCKISFFNKFPNLINKCRVLENFIFTEEIISMANAYSTEFENDRYFVSVCRLGEEKGLTRAISILGEIKKTHDIKSKWVIVGEGPERSNIEQAIELGDLKNVVYLVGEKKNPYPYMKSAKALILVSLHEAAPMVFGESAVLKTPIFSTNTCSALELVKKRGLGIVVDNSNEGIRAGFEKLFLQSDFNFEMQAIDVNNFANKEIQQFYFDVLEGKDHGF